MNNMHGSVNTFLNWKDIAKYEFLLPPMEEQKKISEVLWEIENSLIISNKYLDKLNELQKKISLKLLKSNKNNNIKLGEVITFSNKKRQAPYNDEKYVGLEHVDSGISICNNFESAKNVKSVTSVFKKGDILYGKLRPYLDKVAIASFDGLCTTEILVINATKATTNDYLMLFMRSKDFINYNTQFSFGTKMPRTSPEIISNYEAYIPSLEKQKEILNITNSIKKNRLLTQFNLKNLKSLRNKLSNELLKGTLRLE